MRRGNKGKVVSASREDTGIGAYLDRCRSRIRDINLFELDPRSRAEYILRGLTLGAPLKAVLKACRVSERQFEEWCEDPEFRTLFESAEASGYLYHVGKIAGAGDWKASKAILEVVDPDTWSTTEKHEITHAGEQPSTAIVVASGLERLSAILDAARDRRNRSDSGEPAD